jgi:hypothetical protein
MVLSISQTRGTVNHAKALRRLIENKALKRNSTCNPCVSSKITAIWANERFGVKAVVFMAIDLGWWEKFVRVVSAYRRLASAARFATRQADVEESIENKALKRKATSNLFVSSKMSSISANERFWLAVLFSWRQTLVGGKDSFGVASAYRGLVSAGRVRHSGCVEDAGSHPPRRHRERGRRGSAPENLNRRGNCSHEAGI